MPFSSVKNDRRSWIFLCIILVGGFLLRVYKLDNYSIFFDEKSTLVVSQGIVLEGANQKDVFAHTVRSVPEFWKKPELDYKPLQVLRSFTYKETFIPKTFTPAEFWAPKSIEDYYDAMTRSDIGNSPFYYLLLHYWIKFFGMSDYAVRFFSVIFSVLIIGLTYIFGKRFFNERTGLIAAAIVAVEPFFIAYSHQARNYSLTFFLTLLATYFFLRIMEEKNRNLWLYAGYALAAGLSLLSHFLTISVLLAHAFYALLFLRNVQGWIKMAVTALVALSGVTWWMVAGGGQYTLYSLSYQADLYRRMAETMPYNNPFGVILPATPLNVFNKALPVFADLIIFTNGLTDALLGKRNVVIAILIGILLIIWNRVKGRVRVSESVAGIVPFVLLAVGFAVYTNHRIQFTILPVAVFALSFIPALHAEANQVQRRRLWMLYIMGLVPTLFLILMSFKNGHTFGITQRYSGFSFPYVIILLSLLLQYYLRLAPAFRLIVYGFLALQLGFVALRLQEFYEDRSVKYGYFPNPRQPNPYYEAAERIKMMYQKGDTVRYPARGFIILSEMDRTFLPYSVQDAQLTNLYLPKDAAYVQAMDTTQTESILLKRPGSTKPIEIMRLKGLRYGSE
ncbi:glycosyltransferase family 39 protein [Dyadobacter sandarakinus]|uniref:Glycosyltransferase family 39 protein n=1 Tax=Dyadobacter sandarakinus TaxID=2747268 RepID=A0ABX7I918_9BACT|nr:glycosyltransferase family 39 protein [Dyadobacter sandarakinus]QRR01668.1 glycosyltransferase family 39 protein [Dyadobacter sandarakinus]